MMMMPKRLFGTGRAVHTGGRRLALASFLFGLAFAQPLFAQQPIMQMPNEASGLLQWGAAVGIAAIACLAAFINSKRSHLS